MISREGKIHNCREASKPYFQKLDIMWEKHTTKVTIPPVLPQTSYQIQRGPDLDSISRKGKAYDCREASKPYLQNPDIMWEKHAVKETIPLVFSETSYQI